MPINPSSQGVELCCLPCSLPPTCPKLESVSLTCPRGDDMREGAPHIQLLNHNQPTTATRPCLRL